MGPISTNPTETQPSNTVLAAAPQADAPVPASAPIPTAAPIPATAPIPAPTPPQTPWEQKVFRGIYISRYQITNNASEEMIRDRVRHYRALIS